MYEKADIEVMLKKYLKSKSQLEELEDKIEKNKILIKFGGTKYEEDTEAETIEAMALKSPIISDIPKSKTNKISNQTQDIAFNYKKNNKYINKVDKIQLKNENIRYNEKAEPLRDLVGKVNRMLNSLNNEQKIIIQNYYFYETKWNYVQKSYMTIYNEPKTINQLKNIRDKALKIMLDVINV